MIGVWPTSRCGSSTICSAGRGSGSEAGGAGAGIATAGDFAGGSGPPTSPGSGETGSGSLSEVLGAVAGAGAAAGRGKGVSLGTGSGMATSAAGIAGPSPPTRRTCCGAGAMSLTSGDEAGATAGFSPAGGTAWIDGGVTAMRAVFRSMLRSVTLPARSAAAHLDAAIDHARVGHLDQPRGVGKTGDRQPRSIRRLVVELDRVVVRIRVVEADLEIDLAGPGGGRLDLDFRRHRVHDHDQGGFELVQFGRGHLPGPVHGGDAEGVLAVALGGEREALLRGRAGGLADPLAHALAHEQLELRERRPLRVVDDHGDAEAGFVVVVLGRRS